MNSVLLIGHRHFTDGLRSQVRGLDALAVTAVNSVVEAVPLVEKATPDVIIVQSGVLIANSIVKTFGCHQISHVIVIETTTPPDCDPEQLNILQFEKTSSALESGAHAYLWIPFVPIASQKLVSRNKPRARSEAKSEARSGITSTSFSKERMPQQHPEFSEEVSSRPSAKPSSNPFPSNFLAETSVAGSLSAHAFTPGQCRLIQAHIQIGLSQAQRYRNLSRINDWLSAVALIDALTQIHNRRALDLELPNQIKMAHSNGAPLSLMVLDIDYFKSVNDRFGHLVGDDILKQLAKRLLSNMRFYDTPFRFGGEEFVITLNNTDATEGSAIANRLREIISNEPFILTHPVNEVSKLDVTVSIGLTELCSDDDEQGRSLLNRADKNLLIAKASGRNQVVPAPSTSISTTR